MATLTKPTNRVNFDDIYFNVSWAAIAKDVFGKSSSWMYNKINNRDGNGGEGRLTESERAKLREALLDIASRITEATKQLE